MLADAVLNSHPEVLAMVHGKDGHPLKQGIETHCLYLLLCWKLLIQEKSEATQSKVPIRETLLTLEVFSVDDQMVLIVDCERGRAAFTVEELRKHQLGSTLNSLWKESQNSENSLGKESQGSEETSSSVRVVTKYTALIGEQWPDLLQKVV